MRERAVRLALTFLSVGATGFLLLESMARESIPEPAAGPSALPSGAPEDASLTRAVDSRERVPMFAPKAAPAEVLCVAPIRSEPAQKEREYLADFLALESTRPGMLEQRAEELLFGNSPPSEKVALLRALGQSGSQQHLVWLERAASSLPDDGGAHGVSVARYALGQLVAVARSDAEALPALRRLAFETRPVALDLVRSAALGLARSAGEAELGELRVALARESDAVLVAGVVEALRERPDSPQAVRLVAECTARD